MRTSIAERQLSRVDCRHTSNVVRGIMTLSVAVALGMFALCVLVLLDGRKDVWRQAEQASNNLTLALERDIAHNVSVYDLSLRGVAEALKLPGIDQVSPEIRQMTLFDQSASAEYLGSILVLNTAGDVVEDSTSAIPHKLNLADRDYFRIQQERPDAGLYVSRPFRSRLRKGDLSIAISRRISGPDGSFGGVVEGAMRLAYFHNLFSKFDLGPSGTVTLFRTDGVVIARNPSADADFDLHLGNTDNFRILSASASGNFVGPALHDGVTRLYTFRRVGNLPLILSVAISVDGIYEAWWPKAIVLGAIMSVLCAATGALALLFRREMVRRVAAEIELVNAAAELAVLAATDSLTGLENRRSFDAGLLREWRRAIRGKTPIALLMLDVDCFKLYNDRYGHQKGDLALQSIATCIQQNIRRPGDLAARFGGEEFVVVLPDTPQEGASLMAERIRNAVAELGIPHVDSANGRVTVSIGVAVAHPLRGDTDIVLVKDADEALYEAKHRGRNRVSTRDGVTLLPI